ncbi:MAG: AbrB/MazE/SpoVT family DNA-binding domain-containing protein [Spirochaetia bacterium]|nr:AbrB/MazE/SpoVT family DNA-binding domain-containing protein [Spirochaetia bacterium]
MEAVVQKWGNSLGLRIPSIWAKENEVKNGNKVELVVEKGRIIILPHKKSLDDMLEKITPENMHSEIKTGPVVGNEEW